MTVPMTSSSPLSVELEESELGLVSMATSGSGSVLDSDWLLCGEEAGEKDEGAGVGSSELGLGAQGGFWWLRASGWLPWSCPVFIMLFMALCISSSMRCFSLLGIRPKRTAVGTNTQPDSEREQYNKLKTLTKTLQKRKKDDSGLKTLSATRKTKCYTTAELLSRTKVSFLVCR